MDIYWIRNKQRCGPVTVPDMISLVQMGEVSRDALGWHAGCAKWMPLHDLPALADFLDELEDISRIPEREEQQQEPAQARELTESLPPPPTQRVSPEQQQAVPQQEASATPQPTELPFDRGFSTGTPKASRRVFLPSPGTRLMARLVDYSLFLTIFYAATYVMKVEFNELLLPLPSTLMSSLVVWMTCALAEGICLSRYGTTPGKALMGIRMSVFGDAENISILRGTLRAVLVFMLGCGMMNPLLGIMFGLLTLWLLSRRGITMWDARCSTLPVQIRPATTERILAAIAIIGMSFMAVSYFLTPWLVPMLNRMEQQQPGITQKLAPLLPPEYMEELENAAPAPEPQVSPVSMAPRADTQHTATPQPHSVLFTPEQIKTQQEQLNRQEPQPQQEIQPQQPTIPAPSAPAQLPSALHIG